MILKMIKSDRRGNVVYSKILQMIIAIISFIILIGFVWLQVEDSRYESSLIECNFFVSNMKPDETFFNGLTEPKGILIKTLADTCPSKTVEIRNRNVEPLAELSKDCYYKMANGRDIMAVNSYEKSICVFCGFAKSEDDVSDLGFKLEEIYDDEEYEDLFKEQETLNLNSVTLSKEVLSELSVSEEENLMIYYFIYRPPIPPPDFNLVYFIISPGPYTAYRYREHIKTFFLGLASKHGSSFVRTINNLVSESATESVSGVIIQEWRSENEEFEIINEGFPALSKNQLINIDLSCSNFVIPTKHYD